MLLLHSSPVWQQQRTLTTLPPSASMDTDDEDDGISAEDPWSERRMNISSRRCSIALYLESEFRMLLVVVVDPGV